jgi:hypothetical protein
MCKEMPVISVNKVVDPKRIIQKKNGGRRRRRGTERPKGSLIPPPKKKWLSNQTTKFRTGFATSGTVLF